MKIGCLVLIYAIQLLWLLIQLPQNTRYFSWAMYHGWYVYSFSVKVNSEPLSKESFRKRYGFSMTGSEGRSIFHKVNIIKAYEDNYENSDRVEVRCDYQENGIPQSLFLEFIP